MLKKPAGQCVWEWSALNFGKGACVKIKITFVSESNLSLSDGKQQYSFIKDS